MVHDDEGINIHSRGSIELNQRGISMSNDNDDNDTRHWGLDLKEEVSSDVDGGEGEEVRGTAKSVLMSVDDVGPNFNGIDDTYRCQLSANIHSDIFTCEYCGRQWDVRIVWHFPVETF
jgi:hypothetical protein